MELKNGTCSRETVRGLVAKHAGPEAVREAMESERGYDESLWKLLCEQVGAAALVVPEELGGAGGELADAAAVLEELGRGLVPTPLLGTTLAELALLAADEPSTPTRSRQLAAGDVDRRRGVRSPTTSSTATSPTSSSRPTDGAADPVDDVHRAAPSTRWTRPAGWPACTARTTAADRRRSRDWPTPRLCCWPPSRSAQRRGAWS